MAEEQQKGNGLTDAAVSRAGGEAGKRIAQKVATQAVARAAGAAAGIATGGLSLLAAETGSRAATFINKHKGTIAQGAGALIAAPFLLGATILSALGAGLAAIGSAFLIAIIAVPVTIAFILLIINNSAYMVPPSTSTSGGNVFFGGDIPDGCPAPIWPVSIGQGQVYRMSQGPGGSASHDATRGLYPYDVEAVDISKWPQGGDGSNHLVIATHSGTVSIAGVDQYGGNFVIIRADCSPEVVTNYVHMWNLNVHTGQRVNTGDVLGVVGDTGFSGGIHVHYEFMTSQGRSKNREMHPPPYMVTPYVPQTPPFGCVFYSMGPEPCLIEIQ